MDDLPTLGGASATTGGPGVDGGARTTGIRGAPSPAPWPATVLVIRCATSARGDGATTFVAPGASRTRASNGTTSAEKRAWSSGAPAPSWVAVASRTHDAAFRCVRWGCASVASGVVSSTTGSSASATSCGRVCDGARARSQAQVRARVHLPVEVVVPVLTRAHPRTHSPVRVGVAAWHCPIARQPLVRDPPSAREAAVIVRPVVRPHGAEEVLKVLALKHCLDSNGKD